MAGSTINHGIMYPESTDYVKDPAYPSKLATDISRVAVGADNAASSVEYRAKAHALYLDEMNRQDWNAETTRIAEEAKAYTDASFDAAGGGGATDAQVDAAVERAVLDGRIADPGRLPSGDRIAAGRGDFGVVAADYGAVPGDETVNNRWRLQAAIDAAKGRDVVLEGGKEYYCAGTITLPTNGRSVSLKGIGAEPAVLYTTGQSSRLLEFDAGAPVITTSLTQNIGYGGHGWTVASTEGIVPGMLCEVVSSAPWYFDPRPESAPNDARKSELHRVQATFDGRVFFDDPANDGYVVASETVQLVFYNPISVKLENITVRAVLPAPGPDTKAIEGIVIRGANEPILTNVNAINCARTGVAVYRSYRPRSYGGYSRGSNNFWNGYGMSINGCAHAYVKERMSFECRRGIDVTGFNVISRKTRLVACTTVGGGVNSTGERYSWNTDGTRGADQYGFGTHGPADETDYIGCRTIGVVRPFSLRGRNERIVDPFVVGQTYGGVVQLSYGVNLWIDGGHVSSGYWGYKNTWQPGGAAAAVGRADCMVRVYDQYQANPPSGTIRGRLSIKGVSAEVADKFLHLGTIRPPLGRLTISDVDVYYGPTTSGTVPSLIHYEGTEPATGKSAWFIGPVRMTNEVYSTTPVLAAGLSLSGAKVVDYTVAT